jgi:hypothetical protein
MALKIGRFGMGVKAEWRRKWVNAQRNGGEQCMIPELILKLVVSDQGHFIDNSH